MELPGRLRRRALRSDRLLVDLVRVLRHDGRLVVVGLVITLVSCDPLITPIGVGGLSDSEATPAGDASMSQGSAGSSESGVDDLDGAARCISDLSGVSKGDFQVSFRLSTSEQATFVALVNQRGSCDDESPYWDIRLYNGLVFAEINAGNTTLAFSYYTDVTSTGASVSDGRAHDIVVRRSSLILTVYVDGQERGSESGPASLGALAPVKTGSDVCDGNTADGGDGTMPLVGTITDLCIVEL
jgi:hypothetical protein